MTTVAKGIVATHVASLLQVIVISDMCVADGGIIKICPEKENHNCWDTLVEIVQLKRGDRASLIIVDIDRVVVTVVLASMGTAGPEMGGTNSLHISRSLYYRQTSPGYRQSSLGYKQSSPAYRQHSPAYKQT